MTAPSGRVLHGEPMIAAVKKAGVSHVLSVPDIHTAKGLLTPIRSDKDFTLLRTCKEDECFGIAAGLSYGDKRALILIQYTGFLYAMNAIEPILDVMGIERHYIDDDADISIITPAINRAYEQSRPVAMLIGRRPL